MFPCHPSPPAAVLMRCVRVRGRSWSILLLPCYQPVLVLAAVLGMLFTATNTKLGTRNPGHHTIALWPRSPGSLINHNYLVTSQPASWDFYSTFCDDDANIFEVFVVVTHQYSKHDEGGELWIQKICSSIIIRHDSFLAFPTLQWAFHCMHNVWWCENCGNNGDDWVWFTFIQFHHDNITTAPSI